MKKLLFLFLFSFLSLSFTPNLKDKWIQYHLQDLQRFMNEINGSDDWYSRNKIFPKNLFLENVNSNIGYWTFWSRSKKYQQDLLSQFKYAPISHPLYHPRTLVLSIYRRLSRNDEKILSQVISKISSELSRRNISYNVSEDIYGIDFYVEREDELFRIYEIIAPVLSL